MTKWSSEESLKELRPWLSLFLRETAKVYPISGVIDDVFQLEPGEFDRLIAAHVATDPVTTRLLSAADNLVRTLPSSVSRTEVEMAATVRGPVDWSKTAGRRYAAGDSTLFVCRPTERRYDSPLAHLLARSLRECERIAELAFEPSGDEVGEGVGASVRRVAGEAHRIRTHSKLAAFAHGRIPRTPDRVVEAIVRRRPSVLAVVEYLEMVDKAFHQKDPALVIEVMDRKLLAPDQADKIFELQVGFRIIDRLRQKGFEPLGKRLIGGAGVPLFEGRHSDGRTVLVAWQTAIWTLFGPRPDTAIYSATRRDAGMAPGYFLPDLIVTLDNPARRLFIEVKLTEGEARAAEGQGISEMLAYIFDAESVLADVEPPHGLVVAWNSSGRPARSRVMVGGQDDIGQAIEILLNTS